MAINILWCGGEDIDFPGVLDVSTNTTFYRSGADGFARCAIANGGYGTKGSISKFTPITSGWLSSRQYPVVPTGYNTNMRFIGFFDSTTNKGLFFGSDSSVGQKLALWKYEAGTWTEIAYESGTSIIGNSLHKYDFQLSNYGINATINIYQDGTLKWTWTGDCSISGVSGFDSCGLGSFTSGYAPWISEIIIADDDTRDLSVRTLVPNADGDLNDWTGSYTGIDEIAHNDSDLIYVNTTDKDFQANLTTLPTGTFAVLAVKLAARATKTNDAAIGTLKLGVKSGGTVNVDSGHALSTGWETYERLMGTNPALGGQWLQSQMDALQIDLRSGT